MKAAQEIKKWYVSTYESFEERLNGGANNPVHTIRRDAIERFGNLEFPTMKHEQWKYTNVAPLLKHRFSIPDETIPDTINEELKPYVFDTEKYHTMVFVNGLYQEHLSVIHDEGTSLQLKPLAKAITEQPEHTHRYLAKVVPYSVNIFSALSTAFIQDGVYLYVRDNYVAKKPIQIVYYTTSDKEVITTPRNLFVLGKNAQVEIVETYAGKIDSTYFTNAVTEGHVGENAQLEHVKIQYEDRKAYHISNTEVEIEKYARYNTYNVNFGGSLVRNDMNSRFNDTDANTTMNGLIILHGDQHIDNHTLIDHAKAQCESFQKYKAVLHDSAKGVFNGKVLVRPDAQKTNAFQENKTLLLSDNAIMDSKPELEIFADDVKCSHGATIGELDEESIFYLRSRGIGEELAKATLINAFADDIIMTIKNDEVRGRLEELIHQKLA